MSSTAGRATRTAADAADPTLRGRTYAIPFERVWRTALQLAGGGLNGWSVANADDFEGVITAHARSALAGEHDVSIRISLDADAQTRVDLEVRPLKPASDFGRAARRIRAFLRALDAAATRTAAQVRSR